MKVPHRNQGDYEHRDVRQDVDERSGDQDEVFIYAFRLDLLTNALEQNKEYQCNAIEQVEQDYKPYCVEILVSPGPSRIEDVEEHQ